MSDEDPQEQAAALERQKWITSQLPDLSVPIQPPDVLRPYFVEFHGPAPSTNRFVLVTDGAELLIVDTAHDHYFARSLELHRPWAEELIRLANRPE